MPIERKGGTPAESVMDEQAESPEMESPAEEAGETAELPLSIVGNQPVKEGDVIRLTVVGVNQEGGSLTVTYAHGGGGGMGRRYRGGSDSMAAEFDNMPMRGNMPMKGKI